MAAPLLSCTFRRLAQPTVATACHEDRVRLRSRRQRGPSYLTGKILLQVSCLEGASVCLLDEIGILRRTRTRGTSHHRCRVHGEHLYRVPTPCAPFSIVVHRPVWEVIYFFSCHLEKRPLRAAREDRCFPPEDTPSTFKIAHEVCQPLRDFPFLAFRQLGAGIRGPRRFLKVQT